MPLLSQNLKPEFKTDYRSLTWYLACRAAVITFLLGGAAIFYWRGKVESDVVVPLLVLVGVSYAQALASALLLRLIRRHGLFTQIQIVWDLVFVTVLVLLTGGVESFFSFAYLLVIVAASFLLSRRQTVFAAASAAILFGGILDLQYFLYLQKFGLDRNVSDGDFLSAVLVHVFAFFLTAVLSGTLADRWRKSEAELARKKVDFAELEKLNRTILAHINSGLMLVAPDTRIKTFNRAASEITGLSFEEVYNQPVNLYFPELPLFRDGEYVEAKRAEAGFVKPSGEKQILGYASAVAKGHEGEDIGLLVTFQDLTQLKNVEEDLKRADRLAAVGRLASGMAHEIRNPLASISGSVQLLLEAEHVSSEDRRLMGIVVKEAERLSGLLTDFLMFARPKLPEKRDVDICIVIDELMEMIGNDPRFQQVEIEVECPDEKILSIDHGQVWQVLWDLVVNAAEAMNGQGLLRVFVTPETGDICVEDNGPGIDDDILDRIFDPFFSMKEKGTGLGLASVYSVMEAHGGKVTVGRSDLGGAKFCLVFSAQDS